MRVCVRGLLNSPREAAEILGLDLARMKRDIEAAYKKLHIQPVCVFCEKPKEARWGCTEKMAYDPSFELWHCNGMVLSEKTIEQYRV